MDDKQQNEQNEREETIRDLDVPEEQADGVKGGWGDVTLKIAGFKEPKDPNPLGGSR